MAHYGSWPKFAGLEIDEMEREAEARDLEYEEQAFHNDIDYICDRIKPLVEAFGMALNSNTKTQININIHVDPSKMIPEEASDYVKRLQKILSE
jgi:hypothetical protein